MSDEHDEKLTLAQLKSQEFLIEALKDGARPFRQLQSEARRNGIYNGVLTASRKLLKIEVFADAATGEMHWKLPEK